MSEEVPAEDAPRPRSWLGCGLRVALALAALFALLMGATFVGALLFGGGDLPDEPDTLNAGAVNEYSLSDVTYFDTEHVFIVRLADESFLALYDRSSRAQEFRRDCRVAFDESIEPTGMEQLPGFRGAFVEDCDGQRGVWRADGEFASGAGYGRLDRFATSIDANGDLIVNISQRVCTRSRGVVGVPPFDEQTCGRPD